MTSTAKADVPAFLPTEISLEPSDALDAMPSSMQLTIDGTTATVLDGMARFPAMPDGRFEANLVAEAAPFAVAGPIAIKDGTGRVRLVPVARTTYRIRVLQEDNGESAPYRGVGEAVALDSGGEVLEARFETDNDGWCTVDLRPDVPVRFDPGEFSQPRPTSGWAEVDDFDTIGDRDERTVLRRSWNVRVRVDDPSLIGKIIYLRGVIEVAATIDAEGFAYAFVPPGRYRITRRDLAFDPPTVDVGTGPRTAAVAAFPAPPDPPAPFGQLTIHVNVPPGFDVDGDCIVRCPNGQILSRAAAGTVEFGVVPAGDHEVTLRGHPLLEGVTTVTVEDRGVAEVRPL